MGFFLRLKAKLAGFESVNFETTYNILVTKMHQFKINTKESVCDNNNLFITKNNHCVTKTNSA